MLPICILSMLWLAKRILIFLTILIKRNGWYNSFVQQLTETHGRNRNRKYVDGVTEELDDVSRPDCYTDDLSCVGFNQDGGLVSFRVNMIQNTQLSCTASVDLPGLGQFQYRQTRSTSVGHERVLIQMLEPMRRWKISFRGSMLKIDSEEQRHATISLYWQCVSDPFDHFASVSSWQLAKHLETASVLDSRIWKSLLFQECVWYEQWGELWGSISIEGHECFDGRFVSYRSHAIGCPSDCTMVTHHLCVADEGLKLTSGLLSDPATSTRKVGYVTYPCGERWATDVATVDQPEKDGDNATPLERSFRASAWGIDYLISRIARKVSVKEETDMETLKRTFCLYNVNGKSAFGVCTQKAGIISQHMHGVPGSVPTQESKTVQRYNELTTVLNRESTLPVSIVGGKAFNLCRLKKQNCHVPDGICITTHAFHRHTYTNTELRNAMKAVSEAIKAKELSKLRPVCDAAENICLKCEIREDLRDTIAKELKEVFDSDPDNIAVAVRSSGAGEDGQETSCAGQMSTFLHVTGLEAICKSVQDCWASSLAYQVVEYRRQNGQPVTQPMAVIVQRMVDADVAGVLFTNHPVTGNTSQMVINAQPGQGQAVVSGESVPDTIVVRRERGGGLQVVETLKGAYNVKSFNQINTTSMRTVTGTSHSVCLSDAQILNICNIGLEIERSFGCPQDIEWAIAAGQLVLLQTRPITGLDCETDDLLMHEFDSPVAGPQDCITSCILGEMLPGVASPLSLDVFLRACNGSISNAVEGSSYTRFPQYALANALTFTNRVFLNMTTICIPSNSVPGFAKCNAEVFLMGQTVPENKAAVIAASEGRKKTFLTSVSGFIRHFIIRSTQQPRLFSKWAKNIDKFSIGTGCVTAESLFDSIDEQLHIYSSVWKTYSYKSNESLLWSGVLMGLLRGRKEDMTTENHAEMALLLRDCSDVESANIPTAVLELAHCIASSPGTDGFLSLENSDCHTYLLSTPDLALRKRYTDFMNRHGHRCIREVELLEKSWAMDPAKLMKKLKLVIRSGCEKTKTKAVPIDEAVNRIKTPLTWFQKFLLKKVIVPKARRGVAAREFGKSVTIRTVDVIKQAYWRLAELMVREGRLPEDRLLFFLTHREIGSLIRTRSPSLVRKAIRRMKILPMQEAVCYPKINGGRPNPLKERSHTDNRVSDTVLGMPVGRGVAVGRACVVLKVEEAGNIQKGDVLICPFTDVGWSPYFSLISGLVTEMGGLLSHGAVVAREVGIPCIVNVTGATQAFHTGEQIRMNGTEGSVQRLYV